MVECGYRQDGEAPALGRCRIFWCCILAAYLAGGSGEYGRRSPRSRRIPRPAQAGTPMIVADVTMLLLQRRLLPTQPRCSARLPRATCSRRGRSGAVSRLRLLAAAGCGPAGFSRPSRPYSSPARATPASHRVQAPAARRPDDRCRPDPVPRRPPARTRPGNRRGNAGDRVMGIVVRLDVMLALRKTRSKDLAAEIDITEANLSLLKSGKVEGHPLFDTRGHLRRA